MQKPGRGICLLDPAKRDVLQAHKSPPYDCPNREKLLVPDDYEPTPENATKGRCCS